MQGKDKAEDEMKWELEEQEKELEEKKIIERRTAKIEKEKKWKGKDEKKEVENRTGKERRTE